MPCTPPAHDNYARHMSSCPPDPGQSTPRSIWITGLKYVLLALILVGVGTATLMFGSVYFRRRW